MRELCVVVNDLEGEQLEEESEDGREVIEENEDNIVDEDVINHLKETFESCSEEVINRLTMITSITKTLLLLLLRKSFNLLKLEIRNI